MNIFAKYNAYYITAPHLNKKIAFGHRNLAGEFYVLAGEFSDLRRLMNTLHMPMERNTMEYST